MTEYVMRHYIDAVNEPPVSLDEGILDSIKKWITGLSSPVKSRGQELVKNLEAKLKTAYAPKVPDDVQKANAGWMWSKLTYMSLYKFAIQNGFDDADIDRAFKNPIVNNNLKQLIRSMPADADKPILPLKSANIKTNTSFISTTIDKQTRQYLSKAIAVAVLDGLAYIEQSKKDNAPASETPPATGAGTPPAGTPPAGGTAPAAPAAPRGISTDPEELKSAIEKIKAGLEKMGGTN